MWKPKNDKFARFQKFWRRPKYPGVLGGLKICISNGNAIKLRWPSLVIDEPKNNERGVGTEGGNSNFGILDFTRAKKMCGSKGSQNCHRIENFFVFCRKHTTLVSML